MSEIRNLARCLHLRPEGRGFGGKCPSCGYRGFSLQKKQGRTLFHYHAGGCTQAQLIAALRGLYIAPASGSTRPAAVKGRPSRDDSRDKRQAPVHRVWASSVPIAGTVAEAYLRSRGIGGALPASLRFLPRARHAETATDWPALVAAVRKQPEQEPVAIHRTFLLPDGSGKAPVVPVKKTLGPVRGGAVRLAEAGARLAVAEGIETGLSVFAATGLPTWAALSAGGIEALVLPLPPLAVEVIVCADNDPRGLKAAGRAAARWIREGRMVCVAAPPMPGQDFNDLLRISGSTGEIS